MNTYRGTGVFRLICLITHIIRVETQLIWLRIPSFALYHSIFREVFFDLTFYSFPWALYCIWNMFVYLAFNFFNSAIPRSTVILEKIRVALLVEIFHVLCQIQFFHPIHKSRLLPYKLKKLKPFRNLIRYLLNTHFNIMLLFTCPMYIVICSHTYYMSSLSHAPTW